MSRVAIVLNRHERLLILQHGYPFEGLAAAIAAVPEGQDEATISFPRFECEQLLGDLARSINDCEDARLQFELDELYEYIEGKTELRQG